MIKTKQLKTIEDFEALKTGDTIACEFKNEVDYPRSYKFGTFKVIANYNATKEIILQKKNNIYFNYEMFLQGKSNLISCLLIHTV